MFKYIKSFFTKEIFVIFLIVAYLNISSTPSFFVMGSIYFITAYKIIKESIISYFLTFEVYKENKDVLSNQYKKIEIKNYSKLYKTYMKCIEIIPLIIIPILIFNYLDALTLSIIWGILFINELYILRKIKYIKNSFNMENTDEKNK